MDQITTHNVKGIIHSDKARELSPNSALSLSCKERFMLYLSRQNLVEHFAAKESDIFFKSWWRKKKNNIKE